ncbi:MAG: acyl carrier protein [Polaromonas sp.]|nr:acyl carrier protein [Polaromonas sp.]
MSPEHILALIQQCAREVMPQLEQHEFKPDDSLQALGASSMDRMEIVVAVLEAMSLNIPRVETFGPRTVEELAVLLHEKAKAT